MMLTYIVKTAAWLEIIVGALSILWPRLLCMLLFGVNSEGIAWALARWIGVALFALGVGSLPSKIATPQHRTVLGLLLFNIGTVVLFAWVGITASTRGFLLWPAVILHFLISLALLSQFRPRSTPSP